MADVSKIQLPDGSVRDIKDARIPGVDLMPTSGSTNVVTSNGIDTEFAKVVYLGDSEDEVQMEVPDTIEGITMNGSRVSVTGGVADLGTVLTEHQDISGKQDRITVSSSESTSSQGSNGDIWIVI